MQTIHEKAKQFVDQNKLVDYFGKEEDILVSSFEAFYEFVHPPKAMVREKLLSAATDVLKHLNETCGSKFRETKSNIDFITARLGEGYSVDDCKAVIDIKRLEWEGSTQEKYLRPETLFNSTKFQSYINEVDKARQNPNNFINGINNKRAKQERPNSGQNIQASYDELSEVFGDK